MQVVDLESRIAASPSHRDFNASIGTSKIKAKKTDAFRTSENSIYPI